MINLPPGRPANPAILAADAGKIGGEPVIVLLGPTVLGMGVTAGTGNLRAQENASDVFG